MKLPEITVSGLSVGKTKHDLVVTSPNFENMRTVRIRGQRVYGKKCVRDEQAGGVFLTEKRRVDNAFILVLAVGEKCRSQIEPDQIYSCPDDSPEGIMRSPYCDDDYFIHEDLLQMQLAR